MGKKANKANILVGVCYSPPNQDEGADAIFYGQLGEVSQSFLFLWGTSVHQCLLEIPHAERLIAFSPHSGVMVSCDFPCHLSLSLYSYPLRVTQKLPKFSKAAANSSVCKLPFFLV